MSKVDPGTWDMFADIAAINAWIERANGPSEHEDSMRVMKIGEEYGEAVAAYIGMTGQNPRKGVTHTKQDLLMELADVAITALCAMQHFTEHTDVTRGILASKITSIIVRANIPALPEPTQTLWPPESDMDAQALHDNGIRS